MDVSFTFGSFDFFCDSVVIPLCSLVGEKVEPRCYARNIDVGGNLLFQPGIYIKYIIYIYIYIIN